MRTYVLDRPAHAHVRFRRAIERRALWLAEDACPRAPEPAARGLRSSARASSTRRWWSLTSTKAETETETLSAILIARTIAAVCNDSDHVENPQVAVYDPLVPQRLPRFFAALQRIEDRRKLGQILLEGDEVDNEVGRPLRRSADGHNRDRARGIPIVGRAGGGGASPGTDPVAALLRKEARLERHR